MRTKQQVVSEFRRGEILRAARSVFARRGVSGAIMDQIAKEAGVAKGTVYLYFRSKMEIFRAVLDDDMKTIKKDTLDSLDAAGTLKEKIHAFALVRIQRAEERKDFFRILDSESGGVYFTRSQYRDWLRDPVQRLSEAIEIAAASGEIGPVDAEKAAWFVADMTRGSIQRRLLNQSRIPPEDDARLLSDFIWPAFASRS